MKNLIIASLLLGTVALTGCAHPLVISPPVETLGQASVSKVDKPVAYYISEPDRIKKVTTPGGGGDEVSYQPYADLEMGIYKMLSTKYSHVYVLKSPDDHAYLAEKGIQYVFLPKIETDSKSDSAFTWPPTSFEISMECTVTDPQGGVLWQKTVGGIGEASFSEFKSNFALSAQRASTDVLNSFQRTIDAAPELQ